MTRLYENGLVSVFTAPQSARKNLEKATKVSRPLGLVWNRKKCFE